MEKLVAVDSGARIKSHGKVNLPSKSDNRVAEVVLLSLNVFAIFSQTAILHTECQRHI